jgi:hypothetical protein
VLRDLRKGFERTSRPPEESGVGVPRFLKKFGSQKIETDRFPKNLGTDNFGSRLFRFGFGSNRTNRNFSA